MYIDRWQMLYYIHSNWFIHIHICSFKLSQTTKTDLMQKCQEGNGLVIYLRTWFTMFQFELDTTFVCIVHLTKGDISNIIYVFFFVVDVQASLFNVYLQLLAWHQWGWWAKTATLPTEPISNMIGVINKVTIYIYNNVILWYVIRPQLKSQVLPWLRCWFLWQTPRCNWAVLPSKRRGRDTAVIRIVRPADATWHSPPSPDVQLGYPSPPNNIMQHVELDKC